MSSGAASILASGVESSNPFSYRGAGVLSPISLDHLNK